MAWAGRRISQLRAAVAATYPLVCRLCGKPINPHLGYPHPASLSIDHVIPRSKGGTDALHNLRPVHLRCNTKRGAKNVAKRETGAAFFKNQRPGSSDAPPSHFPPDQQNPDDDTTNGWIE